MYKILLITTILNLGLTIEAAARKPEAETIGTPSDIAQKALYTATMAALCFAQQKYDGYYPSPQDEFNRCFSKSSNYTADDYGAIKALQKSGVLIGNDGKLDHDVQLAILKYKR
jgi:hypothetical protein